jgi:uncharacterized repeat protein (TIGR01451 family)
MDSKRNGPIMAGLKLILPLFCGFVLVFFFQSFVRVPAGEARAADFPPPSPSAPINPPTGYPKFILSQKKVSPSLAATGGAILHYRIEIVNTGAYTATNVSMTDPVPANTTYQNDASSNISPAPVFQDGVLTWNGTVGFDATVVVSFSVSVAESYNGVISNTAVISHASLAVPLPLSAEAMITNDPLFEIQKTSAPALPGANKPLTYTITITNIGQTASGLPVTVTDELPISTTFLNAVDGVYHSPNRTVTWNRNVSLATGESTDFIYSVQVGDVPSGTVIANDNYRVQNPESGMAVGEIYTTTIRDPILFLYKETDPFPPGSNREMTYTLVVLNKGSLATNLVISDTLPSGVTYVSSDGARHGKVVTWNLASLDSGESAQFHLVVYVGDVAEVPVLNGNYKVCSAEGICQVGVPLTSIIKGPTFEVGAFLDPIAKKPGGGGGPVTPTLTLRNIGPGNALDASAMIYFGRISATPSALKVIPSSAGLPVTAPPCGDKCLSYRWIGDLDVGETVTFTVIEGQSTIGGEEGTHYTATIAITDTLGSFISEPITATAVGTVTHFANLIPIKSAPAVIGAGQIMTYSIEVFNSGLSTNTPPFPTLTDSIPASTTLVSISNGGGSFAMTNTTTVSWTLPSMSPGDRLTRAYAVQVDGDLVSGTLIVNDDYWTAWSNSGVTTTLSLSNTGEPITTVVKEVGLIDSFKTVTPTMALPGAGNRLTYTLHVVNTGPYTLTGVQAYDLLPWQMSTYQRDAIATGGEVISDIVSVAWSGDMPAFSEKLITFTVLVDPGYSGPVTNTMAITHESLLDDVIAQAVAYVTDQPVLRISKTASPDPVKSGGELLYTILVENLGQQATELVVTDTLPTNTAFVPYSASGNGQLAAEQMAWQFPVLPAGSEQLFSFKVTVNGIDDIINADYGVACGEGVQATGVPVITKISGNKLFLPLVRK